MIRNATIGAAVWCTLVVAGQVSAKLSRSWIELLFLFAPLTIVPLGQALTEQLDGSTRGSSAQRIAQTMQLPAAFAAALSFYFAPPIATFLLSVPWLTFAALLALSKFPSMVRARPRTFDQLCAFVAYFYLAVGAAWFFASRLGWHPIGFHEPIVLLTAVHFHYAGFAAAVLVRAAGRVLKQGLVRTLFYRGAAAGALAGPAVLAAGFVVHPILKLFAAIAIAAGETLLAVCFVASLPAFAQWRSRLLVCVSAMSIAAAMCLATLWAIGEFPRQQFLDIARMAKWHGTLNALGFTFCGLTAFSLLHKANRFSVAPASLPASDDHRRSTSQNPRRTEAACSSPLQG